MLKRRPALAAIVFLFTFSCNLTSDKGQFTAFVNVNLVPMTSETAIPDQTVLVRGSRIEAVGSSGEIKVPRKATVIDGTGAWLMPGLTDMHVHTKDDWTGPAWPVIPLKLYLANGVTTIRCLGPLGSSPEYVLKWREEIRDGKRYGPAIYTSGPILAGPVPAPGTAVRKQKEEGYDLIKIYSYVTRDEFNEIISTAGEVDIYTAGHIPFLVGLDGVLSEGMDEIAHIEELDFEFLDIDPDMSKSRVEIFLDIIDQAADKFRGDLGLDSEALEKKHGDSIRKIVSRLKGKDISVSTTLVIAEGIVSKLSDPENFIARPETRYLPRAYMEIFQIGQERHQFLFKGHEDLAPFKYRMERIVTKELRRAGINLLLGTDSGTGGMGIVPGFSIHDELRILTETGFTPYEAIKTGTINAAKVVEKMTGKGDFGTVEAGKRADLILVRRNPLESVANIKESIGVMAAGRWYPEEKLKEMIAVE
jgi:hypothetical protein